MDSMQADLSFERTTPVNGEAVEQRSESDASEPALSLAEKEASTEADGPAPVADEAPAGEPAEKADAAESDEAVAKLDRKRIEEQLEALKRKESELRRALAMADHPELAEAIRELEGRAYAVSRVEAKLAQGLSKSEERRKETLEKKLGSLREKRAELDGQIGELEKELEALVVERIRAYESERREAMQQLIACLGTHEAALRTAGLEAGHLVPEIARLLPDIISLAEELAEHKA